jgi:hypothetical protein
MLPDVDAGDDLKEVRQLRAQREMSLELLDVDIDLVDLDLVDVDEDVWIVARLAPLEMRGVELTRLSRSRDCSLARGPRATSVASPPVR